MIQKSKTIVFFGNERLATGVTTNCPTIRALIKNGYNIATIVSHHSHSSPSRTIRELEIESIAKENNIPIVFPEKLSNISDELAKLKPEIGVLVAYGKIVPQSIIDIFPYGIINVHPSDLPLHRGSTPIESVIIDGPNKTAVSIMQLTKEMDCGPIFAKKIISLSGKETKQELANKAAEAGKDLIISNIPDILSGKLIPSDQDDSKATYDKLLHKNDGIIDTTKDAKQIERTIRAYAGWPKSRIQVAGQDIIVTKAHVSNIAESILDIKCANSTVLSIDELIAPSGKKMKASDFLNGYK